MYVGTTASSKEGLLQVSIINGIEDAALFNRLSDGKFFLVGAPDSRFSVRLRNRSTDGRRMEVIVAVDGHDLISGNEPRLGAPGLILESGQEVILSAWGSSDDWLSFRGFDPGPDFSQPITGIIAVAAFLEAQTAQPRKRGSSPDIEPVQEALDIDFHPDHRALALPIPLDFRPGFCKSLREKEFARSPHHSPLRITIGYGETHALNRLGVLCHAEPTGFEG